MQYDMHYYGTYAMAAAAGIPQEDAETIATAAQFVDDQNITSWVLTKSQEGILGTATAHHPLEAGVRTFFNTAEANDTRIVWVPFHFLPGAEGDSFEEKLVCRKDSKVANKLLDHYLSDLVIKVHRPHALQLMGIAAHVYADTFSHCGFSGISSNQNRILNNSIELNSSHSPGILEYLEKRKQAFSSSFTEAASMGHGAVLTHPDRPYLKWSFIYENGKKVEKNNPAIYLEACEALYNRFQQFAKLYYGKEMPTIMKWGQLEPYVKNILAFEAPADARAQRWLDEMGKGSLNAIPCCRYYDAQEWLSAVEEFRDSDDASQFHESDPYKFYAAADYHRNYVLKRLLPSSEIGLLVA